MPDSACRRANRSARFARSAAAAFGASAADARRRVHARPQKLRPRSRRSFTFAAAIFGQMLFFVAAAKPRGSAFQIIPARPGRRRRTRHRRRRPPVCPPARRRAFNASRPLRLMRPLRFAEPRDADSSVAAAVRLRRRRPCVAVARASLAASLKSASRPLRSVPGFAFAVRQRIVCFACQGLHERPKRPPLTRKKAVDKANAEIMQNRLSRSCRQCPFAGV